MALIAGNPLQSATGYLLEILHPESSFTHRRWRHSKEIIVFGKKYFSEVANSYGGKSFKDAMLHLENSSRKIADLYLHTQIRNKEILPEEQQMNFSQALDLLLSEVIVLVWGASVLL